jgi:hypothetical protein
LEGVRSSEGLLNKKILIIDFADNNTGYTDKKEYLTKMREDKIVQFVLFETTLAKEQFLMQWEQFTRSVNSDQDVTLQQSEKNGLFSYIAQHRFRAGEFQFVFEKARRSSKHPEIYIKAEQAGGYSALQSERTDDASNNESKVFAFVTNPRADLDIYRQIGGQCDLNIYQPYYENCRYAYILEFFVKTKLSAELLEKLKQHDVAGSGIYKECALQLS